MTREPNASRTARAGDEAARPPLLAAVYAGNARLVRRLIADGASPHINEHGVTPLNVAVMTNRVDIAQVLLDAGTLVDREVPHTPLPLTVAAHSSTKMVEWLLDHGADPCSADAHLRTYPLVEFAGSERSCLATVVEVARDLDVRYAGGRSPLEEAVVNGTDSQVKLLVAAGASTEQGSRLVELAERNGRGALAEYLRSL